jgi:hypothetical protein
VSEYRFPGEPVITSVTVACALIRKVGAIDVTDMAFCWPALSCSSPGPKEIVRRMPSQDLKRRSSAGLNFTALLLSDSRYNVPESNPGASRVITSGPMR